MVVGLGVLLIHEMGIVGADQFDVIFLGQFDDHLVGLLLQGEGLTVGTDGRICHLMALEFQIVIIAPKALVPLDGLAGALDVALQDLRWYLSGDTGRTDNQVLVVFLQFLTVCTRAVIESVHPGITHKFDQVLIAVQVLGQHDKVVAAQVFLAFLQVHVTATGHIHLTAEDRLERLQSVLLTLFVYAVADVMKFLNAEHVTVICDGHTLHAVGNGLIDKLLDARLSVED